MDVKFLHNLFDALKVTGRSINEDFIPVLYNSLIQLQSENHFDSVYLWGHIGTLSNDYYIAYGYQNDPIKNRIFFYTQNILEWNLMPTDWSIFESDMVRKLKTKFIGNLRHIEVLDKFIKKSKKIIEHTFSHTILNDDFVEDGEEEHREEIKKLESIIFNDITDSEAEEIMKEESNVIDSSQTKNIINEEDRLSITVKMIDNECHIVPRGFFYKLPDNNVVKAPYFKGLEYSEIGNKNNFLHINPQYCSNKERKNKVRSDYNGSIDFLESIKEDIPKGCWTSQIMSNRYLIIHNLLWLGAVFVQDMNTGIHGFFYNGDGLKNLDLPFMI